MALSASAGYTVAQIPIAVFRLPFMVKTSFDPTKDFTYIIGLSGYTFGVVVRNDAPWKTFEEFLADYGVAGPKGMDASVVKVLHNVFRRGVRCKTINSTHR